MIKVPSFVPMIEERCEDRLKILHKKSPWLSLSRGFVLLGLARRYEAFRIV